MSRAASAAIDAGGGMFGLVARHADERPDAIAFRFLGRHGETVGNLDWRAIADPARRIAAHLAHAGLAGKRIGIICPEPADFILSLVGCFACGAIAVPLPAVTNRRSAERIRAIVATAAPDAIISSAAALAQPWVGEIIASAGLVGIDVGELVAGSAEILPVPFLDATSPALIQFTSGSTGTPRGIVLSHANLLANCAAIVEVHGLDANTEGLSWLPLHHDMGLVGHVLTPLFVGGCSSLMNPLHFLQSPLRWLRAVGKYRARITSAPNFAYDLCVREAERHGTGDLDLSSLTSMVTGGEPVWPDTIERFCSTFRPCGFDPAAFAPSYGLAEATLLVTSGRRRGGPVVFSERVVNQAGSGGGAIPTRSVGLGRAVRGMAVRIVDANGKDCAEHTVGEIEVSGTSVGRPFGPDRADFADNAVRTGDLGFLADGELHITGRRKEMIILRGQNVYPADVEAAALKADPAIQPGGVAAIGILEGGTEVLFVVFEVGLPLPEKELLMLSSRVTEAVIKATGHTPKACMAVRVGTLPRTTSGKIQRGRLATLVMSDRLHHSGRSIAHQSSPPTVLS